MPVNVLVGYDGSADAMGAIDAGARLFPSAHATIAYLWSPPFAGAELRHRLRATARNLDELNDMTVGEGKREAAFIADTGVALARYRQWNAEPVVKQTWGGEASGLVELAEKHSPDVTVVGARGIGGVHKFLGSVSSAVVRHSTRPVLIVPRPMLAAEHAALADGPILVGSDGSPGAEAAVHAAQTLFAGRRVLVGTVSGHDSAPQPADSSVIRLTTGGGTGAGATSQALVRCANQNDAAALVVGSRGRSAAREIVLGSVARATLQCATRPVLIVPSARPVTPRSDSPSPGE
ncbi:universal stress protein [Mycobacterium sp. PS03-16]|uniref:universal stress protein n=1 Tax=Mycobacterium sp. PS03-16 TaxID=2559611 RepID=UPI001073E087|nr:universal stress protein [Mycobacterium sp. PS03-16]TFV54535.1 universal stress protein [Mycobacterium sp. PS03-16]